MQYTLCPRCNFKVQANRRICSTCGYEAPKVSHTQSVETDSKPVSKKGSVWARVLGFNQQEGKAGESGHENPALG